MWQSLKMLFPRVNTYKGIQLPLAEANLFLLWQSSFLWFNCLVLVVWMYALKVGKAIKTNGGLAKKRACLQCFSSPQSVLCEWVHFDTIWIYDSISGRVWLLFLILIVHVCIYVCDLLNLYCKRPGLTWEEAHSPIIIIIIFSSAACLC